MFGQRVKLCDGPAILEGEGGFFYEFALSEGSLPPDTEVFPALEHIAKAIIKSKCVFERLQTSKAVASPLFADNNAKSSIIQRLGPTEPLSLYRSGDFVDLCRGPHVPNAGVFRAFHLYRAGGSHVGGKEFLHRIYGIAFPTAAQLVTWQSDVEAAKLRDHRVIGRTQHLFFFHDLSPGSAFLLPHGTRIYNKVRSTCLPRPLSSCVNV
jgi:threonyl-tRNA synthetase